MSKNNKGFTLLEVIIAMAILSVVVFVGYKIINGSNKVTNSQKHTSNGQLSTNLVNKYVSKDIEILESKKDAIDTFIESPSTVNVDESNKKYSQTYTYTLDTVNHDEAGEPVEKVEYIVNHTGNIDGNELKGTYSVNRISKKSESRVISKLELISNQKTIYIKSEDIDTKAYLTTDVRPFSIDDKGTNLYSVGVHYESNNKEKYYAFDVSPRMSLSTIKPETDIPVPPKPEEILPPPGFGDEYAHVGYWASNREKKEENNIYTWINIGTETESDYGTQVESSDNRYGIEGNIRPGNKGSVEESMIDCTEKHKHVQPKCAYTSGIQTKVPIEKISVYVSANTVLEKFYIEKPHTNTTIKYENIDITDPSLNTKLDGGENGKWHNFIVEGADKINTMNVRGDLIIDESGIGSGYAVIMYGNEK